MTSSKRQFAPRLFASRMFAAALFRGVGPDTTTALVGPGIELRAVGHPTAIVSPGYECSFASPGYSTQFRSRGDALAITLPDIRQFSAGETRVISVDLTEDCDYAISSVTVAEVTTADLTFSSASETSAETEILGVDVAAGYAVEFTVDGSGASSGTTYRIRITSTLTNSEVVIRDVLLECV